MNYCLTLIAVLLLSGCAASKYTASTEAMFTKDGTTASYKSDKDQHDFHVRYELDDTGKLKAVEIDVGKSSTPEAAIAAALQTNLKLLTIIEQLLKSGGKP